MKKSDTWISGIGGILLLVGAVLQITGWVAAPYIYLVGAVAFAYEQVKYGYNGNNFIIRRLRRQQILGAMLLVAAGVMMLCMKRNEWIVCLSAAAVIELYTAFRIPQEEEREKKK